MIRHLVGTLEPKILETGGVGHAQLLEDHLVLPSPQELKINHDLPTGTSHVIIRMTRFSKGTYLLYAGAAALTPAATQQTGPEYGREHPRNLSVCAVPTCEERD